MIVENSVTEDSWGLLISVPSDFKWQRTFSLSPNNSLLLYPLFYYKTVDIFIGMDHLFQIKCSFFNAIFSYFLIFLINRVPGLCSTWMIRLWSDKVTEIKYICSWVHNVKTNNQVTGWDPCSNRGGRSPKFLLHCQERKIHQNLLYWPLVMGQ